MEQSKFSFAMCCLFLKTLTVYSLLLLENIFLLIACHVTFNVVAVAVQLIFESLSEI